MRRNDLVKEKVMSDSLIFLIVVTVLAVILVGWIIGVYNKLVRLNTMKEEGWSGVAVQLKKRHDLIPNLVNAVKGYMTHEKDVLENVVKARALGQAAKNPTEAIAAEGMLSQSLGRLFSVVENYPDLKASAHVMNLQKELGGVEEGIQLARRYYNATARNLNILTQSFPSNLVADLFHFSKAAFFELDSPADKEVPVVKLMT
jgi:LemA protein